MKLSEADEIDKLPDLPDKPGVYLMHDINHKVLYVGKAKSLRKRVKSYFRDKIEDPKTRALMGQFNHLEYIVTDSEKEALILESNLIKKHLPRYNVRLKDDKRFPYIKITPEEFPRLLITRKYEDDGGEYYGPYTDVKAVRRIIKFMKPIFRVRDCKRMDGPCLNYQIDLCTAPCQGNISREEYNNQLNRIKLFLEGKYDEIKQMMQDEMAKSSENHEFEKAAVVRDQLNSLDEILEKQKMELNRDLDQDVISFASGEEMAVVVVFSLRNGKIMSKEDFLMEGVENKLPEQIFSAFIKQYFSGPRQVPQEILLPNQVHDEKLITDWLTEKREGEVIIKLPETTLERSMVRMVTKNAEIIKNTQNEYKNALVDLKEYLKIPTLPLLIEAFDISNIGGKNAVGSMVVFEKGTPKKSHYRRYKIHTSGPDDYAMMKELIERRYTKVVEEGGQIPDLILIDGGRGQLNVALDVLKSLKISTGLMGLAKEYDHIFIPELSTPIILPSNSRALHLLQMIRDEAHRFAIEYHKKLRSKEIQHSVLDEIEGIGPKRKKILIKNFGSADGVRKASLADLRKVKGINNHLAQKIYYYLKEDKK